MNADPGHHRRQFWLLQTAGWLLFGLVSSLGALPYRDTRPILLYFAGTTVAGFLLSFPLWLLCRRLANSDLSWGKVIPTLLLVCYALGMTCSLAGAAIEVWFGHPGTDAPAWSAVPLVGFANAFSPTIVLVAWSGIYFGVRQWQETRRREQRLLLSKSLARDAELRALRYQITPHFLFNTLNGISTLVGEGQIQPARRMIALLAEFLRSTLNPAERGDVTLAEEVRQVRQYIAIEQIRLGERLQVSIESAADVQDVPVPHLLLQPLVENALRHGIAPQLEGGTLTLKLAARGPCVRIELHNTYGPPPAGTHTTPAGLGLANTAARLTARYGNAHRFSATGDPARGWTVVVEIPRDDGDGPVA